MNRPNKAESDGGYQLKEQAPGVDVKGSVFTLTVLRLLSDQVAAIERDLQRKIALGPRFFEHAPVVLDLEALRERKPDLDFLGLVATLKRLLLVPVGIRNGTPQQQEEAIAAGLAVVKAREIRDVPTGAPSGAPAERAAQTSQGAQSGAGGVAGGIAGGGGAGSGAVPARGQVEGETGRMVTADPGGPSMPMATRLIEGPVRAGQQVYARGGDLVVLSAVNAGGEVVADGHIHVYGPLRGRALAGAAGDTRARIFCQSMEAQLVSIAGCYQVLDDSIPPALRRMPVQVHLAGERLCLSAITRDR